MTPPVFPDESRRPLTIQTKLSGVILGLVAVIVIPFSVIRTTGAGRTEANLQNKARVYGELAAGDVAVALARGDRASAQRLLQPIATDPDFAAVGLYSASGEWVVWIGSTSQQGPVGPPLVTGRAGQRVRAVVPVQGAAGPTGTLVVELSLQRLEQERAAPLKMALIMGVAALGLGLLAAWLIARSFAGRVRALSDQATAVAAGDLSRRPLQDLSSDEIGQTARAFKVMVERIRTLITQIRESAKNESLALERTVAERTAELAHRNVEMRLVLDNVDQGFVTLDRDGRLSQRCSRIVESWLGPPMPRIPFADWLFQADADKLLQFELGWEALIEAELPRDLLLDQLPRRVNVKGRTIDLSYRPIEIEGRSEGSPADEEPAFDRLLVVMTDVTGELARVRAEEAQRELAAVMERYGRDRASTVSFFEEARVSCKRVSDGSLAGEHLFRALHTLKGNARLMGLGSLSTVCHQLESAFVAEGHLGDGERALLRSSWDDVEQRLGFLFGASDKLEIAESDFAAVVRAVESNAARAEILRMLEACRAESLAIRLDHFADQARRIAESLDKLPIEISVEAGALSLPRGTLGEFWGAFVHVIRNAIDHGFESAAERRDAGKPATRRLSLRARLDGDAFVLEVEDDGRGIAWETIRARARAMGLAAQSHDDLVRAMCATGVSTTSEVTELSGRGVGMAAVRDACVVTGGVLQVNEPPIGGAGHDGRPGGGTLMRFRWPAQRLRVLGTGRSLVTGDRPLPSSGAGHDARAAG